MVEIGRTDIATDISLTSSQLVMYKEGHLEAAIHVMSYLNPKQNFRLVFILLSLGPASVTIYHAHYWVVWFQS